MLKSSVGRSHAGVVRLIGVERTGVLRLNRLSMSDGRNNPSGAGSDPITGLHEELFSTVPPKHGTAYERLTALIVQELNQRDDITHDVRLRGDRKKTEHRIDVSVRGRNAKLRLIVECRHLAGLARKQPSATTRRRSNRVSKSRILASGPVTLCARQSASAVAQAPLRTRRGR